MTSAHMCLQCIDGTPKAFRYGIACRSSHSQLPCSALCCIHNAWQQPDHFSQTYSIPGRSYHKLIATSERAWHGLIACFMMANAPAMLAMQMHISCCQRCAALLCHLLLLFLELAAASLQPACSIVISKQAAGVPAPISMVLFMMQVSFVEHSAGAQGSTL